MPASAPAATATSPIASWRRCATSSAAMPSRAHRRLRPGPHERLKRRRDAEMAIAAEQPETPAQTENPLTAGLERLPVAPTTLVIFGATGDLAKRKLLPALYNLAHEGALPQRFHLVGVSRKEQENDDYRE